MSRYITSTFTFTAMNISLKRVTLNVIILMDNHWIYCTGRWNKSDCCLAFRLLFNTEAVPAHSLLQQQVQQLVYMYFIFPVVTPWQRTARAASNELEIVNDEFLALHSFIFLRRLHAVMRVEGDER